MAEENRWGCGGGINWIWWVVIIIIIIILIFPWIFDGCGHDHGCKH